jgi:CRP/FNR family cyclic AMP-dependent transcriptional regulator
MELRTSVATSMPPVNWASPSGRSLEDEIIRVVRGHKALSCLPEEDLRALLRQSTVVRFGERDRIFSQDSEGRNVLLLVQGYVKLSSNTAGGREVVLELAGPGSVFGELAVLNGWRRAADAYALSPCQLVSMEARLFVQTLSRKPEAMLGLIRILSRRLQRANEQITDAVDMPGPQRLGKALISLAGLHSRPVPDGLQINLQLSQRELGAMTGLTRESINKHLSAWRDEGLIRLSDRFITLLDLSALRRRASDIESD